MNKTEALIQTSQEAFDTARVLYQAGQAAPAVYYACHAFEQAGGRLRNGARRGDGADHLRRAAHAGGVSRWTLISRTFVTGSSARSPKA